MDSFGMIVNEIWGLLQMPFTLFGVQLSFSAILIGLAVISLIFWFVGRLFK